MSRTETELMIEQKILEINEIMKQYDEASKENHLSICITNDFVSAFQLKGEKVEDGFTIDIRRFL